MPTLVVLGLSSGALGVCGAGADAASGTADAAGDEGADAADGADETGDTDGDDDTDGDGGAVGVCDPAAAGDADAADGAGGALVYATVPTPCPGPQALSAVSAAATATRPARGRPGARESALTSVPSASNSRRTHTLSPTTRSAISHSVNADRL
jgi:hypothetical protein